MVKEGADPAGDHHDKASEQTLGELEIAQERSNSLSSLSHFSAELSVCRSFFLSES